MSFLTQTTIRSARAATTLAPRAFSTSFVTRKTTTESVKDAVKNVDRKVSEKLVGGIEIGRTHSPSWSAAPVVISPPLVALGCQNLA